MVEERKEVDIKPITEDIMIPKYRFDEINSKYKVLRNKYLILEKEIKKKEKKVNDLINQTEDIKSGYEKALNILRVKEIFVSGGLTEQEYSELVDIISKTDHIDMLELARRTTKLIKKVKGE